MVFGPLLCHLTLNIGDCVPRGLSELFGLLLQCSLLWICPRLAITDIFLPVICPSDNYIGLIGVFAFPILGNIIFPVGRSHVDRCAQIETLSRILKGCSLEFLDGIIQVVRVCVNRFESAPESEKRKDTF